MADNDVLEEFRGLIHKLNHNLTLVYSYIDLSVQYLSNDEITKEEVIQFLYEAQKTYDDVKDIIWRLSAQAKKASSINNQEDSK